jgi:hypothetical protein
MSEEHKESLERCIHQLIRPKAPTPSDLRLYGYGDCSTCTYDEKNSWCEGYTPVRLHIFGIKKEEKK